MLDAGHVQVTEAAVAASGYVGWLAWIDGVPIFEEVRAHRVPVMGTGGVQLEYRRGSPRVRDWPDIDHMRIEKLSLFFLRELYPAERQPVWDCWRDLESDVRLIQFKRRAAVLSAGGDETGQGRTGIMRYTMGTWCPSARPHPECRLWDIQPNPPKGESVIQERPGPRRHPCWPLPPQGQAFDPLRHGFGLGPHVIGIEPEEVPDPAPVLLEV